MQQKDIIIDNMVTDYTVASGGRVFNKKNLPDFIGKQNCPEKLLIAGKPKALTTNF